MVRRNQEWREMLAEVRKIPAADIGVATEYLPLVDFVSNVKKQIEEGNEEDKEVFNNNIKPNRENNQEEKKLAKFASMSDISMTVFCGDETINNLTNYEEREAYERGLAKLGDNQSTDAMNFPVQDINDDQSRSTKEFLLSKPASSTAHLCGGGTVPLELKRRLLRQSDQHKHMMILPPEQPRCR